MKVIFLCLTISVLIVCNGCNFKSDQNQKDVKKISIEIEEAKSILYANLLDTSSLTYIRLTTSEESLLGEIKKLHIFSGKYIIVSNKLYFFNTTGSFLSSLNRQGRGPEEYLHLTDAYIDRENNIYVLDKRGRKILKYDENGEYLLTMKTGLIGLSFTKLNDDVWAIYCGSEKNEESSHRINFYSESMAKTIAGTQTITDEEYKWMHIVENDNFTISPGLPLYKSVFNDTLYTITNNKISPLFILDWHDNRLPEHYLRENYESIVEFFQDVKDKGYIFGIQSIHSTKDHLCFSFVRDKKYYLAVYNWKTEKLLVVDNIAEIYSIGDVLAPIQPEILPAASDSEFFYSMIEPYYINELEADGKNVPGILANTTETDNPIIIKYKFKCMLNREVNPNQTHKLGHYLKLI